MTRQRNTSTAPFELVALPRKVFLTLPGDGLAQKLAEEAAAEGLDNIQPIILRRLQRSYEADGERNAIYERELARCHQTIRELAGQLSAAQHRAPGPTAPPEPPLATSNLWDADLTFSEE